LSRHCCWPDPQRRHDLLTMHATITIIRMIMTMITATAIFRRR
jgi:hypothetical protein